MDVSFHYYAIKAVAIICGFESNNADIIATYSQFVDDYKSEDCHTLILQEKEVPDYFRILLGEGGRYRGVQTGFSKMEALKSGIQENVLLPFHFIPYERNAEDKKNYVTVEAKYGDGSIVSDIFREQVREVQGKVFRGALELDDLVKLGVVMHVFADTYSHARFNAYDSWLNEWKIEEAVAFDGKKVTYTDWSEIADQKVGHIKVNTAPDDGYVRFSMKHICTGDWEERDNAKRFAECAVEIGYHLCEVMGTDMNAAREKKIRTCVEEGLKVKTSTDAKTLEKHWNRVTQKNLGQNVQYKYQDPGDMCICGKEKKPKREFFAFNHMAQIIKDNCE